MVGRTSNNGDEKMVKPSVYVQDGTDGKYSRLTV